MTITCKYRMRRAKKSVFIDEQRKLYLLPLSLSLGMVRVTHSTIVYAILFATIYKHLWLEQGNKKGRKRKRENNRTSRRRIKKEFSLPLIFHH